MFASTTVRKPNQPSRRDRLREEHEQLHEAERERKAAFLRRDREREVRTRPLPKSRA